ncbi:MAG: retroviral-like aspartic protease family protein [Myxococcaceae bacterium]|nr:retroviral-like aspartic protease family protein [Myxococcaceae bacterium]
MTSSRCYQHPQEQATTQCGRCQRPLCVACATFEGGLDRCQECLARYGRGKRLRQRVLLALGVVGLVGGAAVLVTQLGSGGEAVKKEPPPFNYGSQAERITRLRWQHEHQPCDQDPAVAYIQAIFSAGNLQGASESADSFIARCGKSAQVRQITYSVHTRLADFERAARDATELLEDAPHNINYWVWRALAHEAGGESQKALADFQQAFDLQPRELQLTRQLASAYERLHKPCEALLVLLQHLQANPEERVRTLTMERAEQLAHEGQCDTGGRGQAVVSVAKEGPRWVEPRVEGKERGRFLLDTLATKVTLSQAFADKLGLNLTDARSHSLRTGDGPITVRLATLRSLELQGARVENLEVGVSSTLPQDVDGLLGLGFLARFEVKLDAQAGRLELKERPRIK